jgi:hypothetical protein
MSVTKPFKRTVRQLSDGSYQQSGNGQYVRHPLFANATSVVFEITPGFTALLGPNNAGKSSAKRLFYKSEHTAPVMSQAD